MKTTEILRRKTGIAFLVLTLLLALGGTCSAAEYVSLKIFPEHVGVFTTDGEQQFVAIAYDAAGRATNVTDQVSWKSSDANVATINESGLATVISKSGQALITASYPKGGGGMIPVNHLLLGKQKR